MPHLYTGVRDTGSDPRALPRGTKLGQYRVERVLGRGGFGFTYLATSREHDGTTSRMAIKELFPDGVDRGPTHEIYPINKSEAEMFEDARLRFHAEALALKKCRHPNIVRILDYFSWNQTGYIIMAYEEGEQLGKYLKKHFPGGGAPQDWIMGILLPLLEGLTHAHGQGVFHRDIKPANIFLTANNRPVLLDFGAAKQLNQSHRHHRGENSQLIVTEGYGPYEQYTYEGLIGPWTDLYAMGAVAHTMITGKAPPSAYEREYKAKGGRDSYERLRRRADLRGQYSSDFLATIDWALELDIARRPQSNQQWQSRLPQPRKVATTVVRDGGTIFQKTSMLLKTTLFTGRYRDPTMMTIPGEPEAPLRPAPQGKGLIVGLIVLGSALVLGSLILLIVENL